MRFHTSARFLTLTLAVAWVGLPDPLAPRASSQGTDAASERHFAVPISLLEEHAELYSALEAAGRLPGETGAAARRLAVLRAPHVATEQRIAYPLLRLLPMLTTGEPEPWMADLLPLADQLRAALPSLKREHVVILKELDALKDASWAEDHPEYAFLAQRLRHHIRMEEEVLYPAAFVTADCVRHGLNRMSRR
jgi:Hemerythrin HHE cation binding domain